VRRKTSEKELRGLITVPLAIGEPITSEAIQRIQLGRGECKEAIKLVYSRS
jgi:hypothetical protein